MSEESSRRHHHHSSGRSSGAPHHGGSPHHHSRRRHRRATDATYEQQRAMVEDIVTQNIGLLHSGVHRVVVMLAVVGVVLGAVFLFLGWNFHQEGSLLRQSVYTVVFLALWFLALKLFQLHKSAVIDLKALMQFQESRIDTLKVSLALRDKAIQEMESKLRRLEQDQEGNGGEEKQDYRKLSGLS